MDERDLTRLSFLADAAVRAPTHAPRMAENVLKRRPSEPLRQAVEVVREAFSSAAEAGQVDLDAVIRAVESRSPDAGEALQRAAVNVRGR